MNKGTSEIKYLFKCLSESHFGTLAQGDTCYNCPPKLCLLPISSISVIIIQLMYY